MKLYNLALIVGLLGIQGFTLFAGDANPTPTFTCHKLSCQLSSSSTHRTFINQEALDSHILTWHPHHTAEDLFIHDEKSGQKVYIGQRVPETIHPPEELQKKLKAFINAPSSFSNNFPTLFDASYFPPESPPTNTPQHDSSMTDSPSILPSVQQQDLPSRRTVRTQSLDPVRSALHKITTDNNTSSTRQRKSTPSSNLNPSDNSTLVPMSDADNTSSPTPSRPRGNDGFSKETSPSSSSTQGKSKKPPLRDQIVPIGDNAQFYQDHPAHAPYYQRKAAEEKLGQERAARQQRRHLIKAVASAQSSSYSVNDETPMSDEDEKEKMSF